MLFLIITVILFIFDIAAIIVVRKTANTAFGNFSLPSTISIILICFSLIFAIITATDFLFQPYSMAEASSEVIILLMFGIAVLGGIYSTCILISKKIRLFVFSMKKFQLYLNISIVVIIIFSAFFMITAPNFLFSRHHIKQSLTIAPKGLGISKVIYGYNTFSGIGGPSDWSMGVNIYQLPYKLEKNIKNRGIDFLNELQLGYIEKWHKTPVINTDSNMASISFSSILGDSTELERELKIIGNPSEKEEKINKIMQETGNYYGFKKNGGIIIVSPKEKWIIFYY